MATDTLVSKQPQSTLGMAGAGTARFFPPFAIHWIATLALPVVFCLLTALGAQLRVPLPGTPVPLTLQLPAMLLCGLALSPGRASLAMILYLAGGSAGLPFFSPESAGLMGPTGGYLLAFPLSAWLVAKSKGRRGTETTAVRGFFAVAAGALVVFFLGLVWLAVWLRDISAAATLGMFPFLLKSLVEVLLVTTVAEVTKRRVGDRAGGNRTAGL